MTSVIRTISAAVKVGRFLLAAQAADPGIGGGPAHRRAAVDWQRRRDLLPQPHRPGHRRPGGAADRPGGEPEAVQLPVQLQPAERQQSATGRCAMTTMTLETPASTAPVGGTGGPAAHGAPGRGTGTLAQPGQDGPRSPAAAAVGRPGRGAGAVQRVDTWAGRRTGTAVALRRVAGHRPAPVCRMAQGHALQPGHRARAAVLVPPAADNATLEVAAVLGMRWPVGKVVSRRSLRGLKPLAQGRRVMVVARQYKVDIAELKARNPWATRWRPPGLSCTARGGCGRASAPFTRNRKAASRCTPTPRSSGASAAAPAATCWTSWGGWRG